jgi:SAM-dependent methyltransferase
MPLVEVKDVFVRSAPCAKNALDLFAGQWVTWNQSGDSRVDIADQEFGFGGKVVLELGPCEGHHTRQIVARGAKHVVAIESNARSFLKCLIVKEIASLRNVDFQLGDAVHFMEACPRFDIVFASGFLYHLADPIKAIEMISRVTDNLFLSTHYYDRDIVTKLGTSKEFARVGDLFRVTYGNADGPDFLGGNEPHAFWMTRSNLIAAIEAHGFSIKICEENLDCRPGPLITLVGRRQAPA